MSGLPDVRVGQVWGDCDWRMNGRRLRVVAVPSLDVPNPGEAKVTVENIHHPSLAKRRIKLRRFQPSTGYRLVEDVA